MTLANGLFFGPIYNDHSNLDYQGKLIFLDGGELGQTVKV